MCLIFLSTPLFPEEIARFCPSPVPSPQAHICSYGQALGQTGLDDLVKYPPKSTLQPQSTRGLGTLSGEPACATCL